MAQRNGGAAPRPDVTFPMAVVDLRPAAAGFDNALAWLARFRGLKAMSIPVARWTRRLVVHLHEIHRETFEAGTSNEHELLCLRVTNGGPEDASGVRFQTRWNADSELFNVKTAGGLWMGARAHELGQAGSLASEETCLVGGGSSHFVGQFAGLAVKYFDDEHAYVITPDNYQQFGSPQQSWRWPASAIAPGLHLVDVAFRSREGGGAIVRLNVMNPGRGANLGVQVAVGQLVSSS